MAQISKPFTFTSGNQIRASEHNTNNDTIYNEFNGNIDNDNIKAGAGIIASKLDLSSMPVVGASSANSASFTNLTVTTINQIANGTWTANFSASSGTITIDNSYKLGSYSKVGREVSIHGYFFVNTTSSPTGVLRLCGLPFTCSNASYYYSAVTVNADSINTSAWSIKGYTELNTNNLIIQGYANGTTGQLGNLVTSGSNFHISVNYLTDA